MVVAPHNFEIRTSMNRTMDDSSRSSSSSSDEQQSRSSSDRNYKDAKSTSANDLDLEEIDTVLPAAANVDVDVDHGIVGDAVDDDDGRKIFLSRIPQSFNEESITRILEAKFGARCVVNVSIVYDKSENHGAAADHADKKQKKRKKTGTKDDDQQPPAAHRGFAFVTFQSSTKCREAILSATVRGSARAATTATGSKSKQRKHTMYIRPVLRDDSTFADQATSTKNKHTHDGNEKDICFLWTKHRCPYGKGCKFVHVGEGACVVATATVNYEQYDENGAATTTMKRKHCFNFKKSGRCKAGDSCPFLHDTNAITTKNKHKEEVGDNDEQNQNKDKSQILCINWKNKGKCRKGERCPYRHGNGNSEDHDLVVCNNDGRQANKAGKAERINNIDTKEKKKRKQKDNINMKQRQSLSIRIFGLNYDTTPDDVRTLLKNCGPIMELTFPTYEDSGRSKGYCGVLFQSPKAVQKAILLDGCELHDRWLRIQEGKMFLKKWEEVKNDRRKESWGNDDDVVDARMEEDGKKESEIGEFGQKVKKRKKHG